MIGSSQNGTGSRNRPRVFVAGALGAVGSLVADLLDKHPSVELAALTARDTGDESTPIGRTLAQIYPEHRVNLKLQTLEELDLEDFDAAIVAYATDAAARLVKELRRLNLTVVDSCADFRFDDLHTYEEWYGSHKAPELLNEAVYGLPEVNRQQIIGAKLVGNPGCYPTASVLALAPLVREGLADDIVIDAKSGVSGAGKRGDEVPPFISTHENMRPYGTPKHRHKPEIVERLAMLGYEGGLSFVPHLIPIDQGELVSCYVKPSRQLSTEELLELYVEAYRSEPFVEITEKLPTARDVQRTNICRLNPVLDHDGGRIFVFATIDNLWKGGASQAVQNLNLALEIDEKDGLENSVSVEPDRPSSDRSPVSA
jgi:N-acetyl-gamma-glutamyl-phosphate reductase